METSGFYTRETESKRSKVTRAKVEIRRECANCAGSQLKPAKCVDSSMAFEARFRCNRAGTSGALNVARECISLTQGL